MTKAKGKDKGNERKCGGKPHENSIKSIKRKEKEQEKEQEKGKERKVRKSLRLKGIEPLWHPLWVNCINLYAKVFKLPILLALKLFICQWKDMPKT